MNLAALRNISILKVWMKTNGTWRGRRHLSLDSQNWIIATGDRAYEVCVISESRPRLYSLRIKRLTAPRYSRQESREGVKKVRKERKDQEIFTWLEKGRDNWAKWRAVSCRHSNFDTWRRNWEVDKTTFKKSSVVERKVLCHCSLLSVLFSTEYRIVRSQATLSEFLERKERFRRRQRETK